MHWGIGGCIVDRGEGHSSLPVQPMPVRHSHSLLLNLIISAETGALDHLPPEEGVQKYLPKWDPAGGTFALPSSGGHPGPGVNVLLILFNFPAKITNKMAVGQKIFK